MVVDDLRALIGSANINDRSLRGDRDSEIACVYEDYDDMIESRMDGKPVRRSSCVVDDTVACRAVA